MADMMPGWGQIVPFARSAKELRQRALTQRKGKQWLEAAELLRRAAEQEPENERILLDLSETYTQMGCSALSNRTLLRVLRLNPRNNECYFAMGCNYYAMQAWNQARDCLSTYVRREPNGPHRREANDMLLTLYLQRQSRVEQRIARATQALENGKRRLASRLMRRAFAVAAMDSDTHAIAAFLQLMEGKPDLSLRLARRAWRLDRRNARALCAMAMSLYQLGSGKTAERFIARAVRVAQTDMEQTMVAHTACEMGADAHALPALVSLSRQFPLDPTVLHMLAVCHCRLGQYREALPLWARMRRIDPDDTVAAYCFEALREAMAKDEPFSPSYVRQAPVQETLNRLAKLRGLAEEEEAQGLIEAWQEQVPVRRLVAWGLQQPEPRIRKVMLGVLRVVGDEHARWMLRDLLILTEVEDAFKQHVLELLFLLGDPGPHPMATSEGFTSAYVQAAEEGGLPTAYTRGLKRLAARLEPEFGDCYEALAGVWKRLVQAQGMLSDPEGWLKALEWLYRTRKGQDGLKADRLTMRRIRRLQAMWEE